MCPGLSFLLNKGFSTSALLILGIRLLFGVEVVLCILGMFSTILSFSPLAGQWYQFPKGGNRKCFQPLLRVGEAKLAPDENYCPKYASGEHHIPDIVLGI